jgi:hypothetical protein
MKLTGTDSLWLSSVKFQMSIPSSSLSIKQE